MSCQEDQERESDEILLHLIGQRDADGQTVLHLAAMVSQKHPTLLALLLDPENYWGRQLRRMSFKNPVVDSCAPYRGPDHVLFVSHWKDLHRHFVCALDDKGRSARDVCQLVGDTEGANVLDQRMFVYALERFECVDESDPHLTRFNVRDFFSQFGGMETLRTYARTGSFRDSIQEKLSNIENICLLYGHLDILVFLYEDLGHDWRGPSKDPKIPRAANDILRRHFPYDLQDSNRSSIGGEYTENLIRREIKRIDTSVMQEWDGVGSLAEFFTRKMMIHAIRDEISGLDNEFRHCTRALQGKLMQVTDDCDSVKDALRKVPTLYASCKEMHQRRRDRHEEEEESGDAEEEGEEEDEADHGHKEARRREKTEVRGSLAREGSIEAICLAEIPPDMFSSKIKGPSAEKLIQEFERSELWYEARSRIDLEAKRATLAWLVDKGLIVPPHLFLVHDRPVLLRWMCDNGHIDLDTPLHTAGLDSLHEHVRDLPWLPIHERRRAGGISTGSPAKRKGNRAGHSDSQESSKLGDVLLVLSAGYGNVLALEYLVSKRNDCAITLGGQSLLHVAARCGRAEIVKILVARHLVPVETFFQGVNAAHLAFAHGHVCIGEYLLDQGCSRVDELGRDYLWHAKSSGLKDMAVYAANAELQLKVPR